MNTNFKEIINVIEKFAPSIASCLGSPIAGVGLSLLENIFPVNTTTGGTLVSAINSDPDAATKLRALELKHGEVLATLSNSDYQTEVNDRKDAREKALNNYDWVVHILSFIVTAGFFTTICMVMFTKADTSDHDILNMMLGVLGTTWVQVMSFYFGSIKK